MFVVNSLHRIRLDIWSAVRQPLANTPAATWALVPPYVAIAAGLGFGFGLFELGMPSVRDMIFFPLALIIFPSVVEEVFFRGLLLPRSLLEASPLRRFLAVTASTAVFVLFHPLNHWTLSLSETSLFVEPAFLVIVAALGYACGYAYLRSGSLRAPILIHWATVVVWNLFLGRPA